MAAKLSLTPACAYGKDDWERDKDIINTSSSSQNAVEQERKDIAHNSAPMTPTSRASSSRNLLSAVSKYQLCHSGLHEQTIMGQSHTWICACMWGKRPPTLPNSLRRSAVTEAAARPPCFAGTRWLHEPGRGWRQLWCWWQSLLWSQLFCHEAHALCKGFTAREERLAS